MMHRHGKAAPAGVPRTSAVILGLAERHPAPMVAFGDILDGLHERAFGLVFVILALGSVMPLPPGTSALLGCCIAAAGLQLLLGGDHPWVPGLVRRRTVARERLVRVLHRAAPIMRRFEAACRPRLVRLTSGRAERLLGLPMLLLGLLIALPLPLTGGPAALATLMIALGLLERDGIAVLAGLATTVVASVVVAVAAAVYAGGLNALTQSLPGVW